MGKKVLLMLPLWAALLAAVWALAAGDAADPLVTLSYLQEVFTDTVDAKVQERLDAAGTNSGPAAVLPGGGTGTWTEALLKQGDLLTVPTGGSVLLLSGSAVLSGASGALVDVTAGTEAVSGAALLPSHRYLAGETSAASVLITSKTAVADHQGGCALSPSGSIDYHAAASALKSLHLFRGTLTGYGQGFELEAAPTRLQALIMFLRVLGEEEAALAWSGQCPFTDLAQGSDGAKYAGYAYERGYTNGFREGQFLPGGTVSAQQYAEFLLRAMGYSSAANKDVSNALERAREAGILTLGETVMLQSDPFLRADLAYVSYYALDALLADGRQTLAESLIQRGVFTAEEWTAAQVNGPRL